MGYSNEPNMVRVDFFKSTGKWYTTLAIAWVGYNGYIFFEFGESLRLHFKDDPKRFSDMDAICLEPYNANAYPIQIKNGGWCK